MFAYYSCKLILPEVLYISYVVYVTIGFWNPDQKVSAQKVSGHKVSKIDNIGQQVFIQNHLNEDNEHYIFL